MSINLRNAFEQIKNENEDTPQSANSGLKDAFQTMKSQDNVQSVTEENTLLSAQDGNADEYAANIDMGVKLKQPTEVVAAAPDIAKNLIQREKIQQYQRSNKPTIDWASKPNNAQLVHDDMDALTFFENTLKTMVSAAKTLPLVMDPARSVTSGLTGIIGTEAERVGTTLEGIQLDRSDPVATTLSSFAIAPKLVGTPLRLLGEGLNAINEFIAVPEEREGIISAGAETIGQVIGTRIAPTAMLSAFFSTSAHQEYEAAKREGATEMQATAVGLLSGTWEAGSEFAGAHKIMELIPKNMTNNLLKDAVEVVMASGIELLEELGASYAKQLTHMGIYDPDREFDFAGDMTATDAAGMFSGIALMSSIGKRNSYINQREEQAQQVENQRDGLLRLREAAEQSRTFGRNKAAFADFVDNVNPDKEDPNVYVDAESVNTFFQTNGQEASEIFEQMGLGLAFAEAVQEGSDLRVPLSALVTMEDTEHFGAMLDDVRYSVGDNTARELREKMDPESISIEEEADRLFKEGIVTEETTNVANDAASQLKDQLVKTGRFEADTAEQYASLHKAFITTFVGRGFATAEQMKQYYNLEIIDKAGVLPDGVTLNQSETTEYEQAVAKGLDMTAPARKQRATDMGFDAETVYYHGTGSDIRAFEPGARRPDRDFTFVTPDFEEAESFAEGVVGDNGGREVVYPLYVKKGKTFDYETASSEELKLLEDYLKKKVNDGGRVYSEAVEGRWDVLEGRVVQSFLKSNNYNSFATLESGVKNLAVFNSNQLRSINAAFDPDFAESANVLNQTNQAGPINADVSLTSLDTSFELAGQTQLQNIRQLKEILQQRVEEQGVDLSVTSPEVKEFLIELGLKDALQALKSNENAIGWYDVTVSKALAVLSTIHPEIATDENAKFAFTFALAVTSNGLKVKKNFELAERVYNQYKQTGLMPTNVEAGQAQSAINESLAQFNEKSAEYGIDVYRQFMISKFSIGQLGQLGFKVTGELAGTEVFGAMTLGPKIGNGFFANLNGHFDQLTIDRWLMRTWGRWTGTLIERRPDRVEAKSVELQKYILQLAKTPTKLAEFQKALRMDFDIQQTDKVSRGKPVLEVSNIEAVAVQIQKMSVSKEVRTIFDRTKSGVSIRTTGNSLAKYIDGQKEAPQNGAERAWMREVFDGILVDMQVGGYADMTMADLQALLWYPEKRLYDAAKSAEDSAEGYSDDEAPDYANAAIGLAKDQGVDPDVIKKAVSDNETNRRTAAARRSAAAPGQESDEAGTEGLDGRERKRFLQGNILWRHRSRRTSSSKTRTYKKASAGTLGGLRGLVHAPSNNYNNVLNSAEALPVTLVELDSTPESAALFTQQIQTSKDSALFGAAVYIYPASEYEGMRLFLSEDKTSGMAIKPDGDIVSVFTNGGGKVYSMLSLAVEIGGTKLDAFDTVLPDIYNIGGFTEVGRDSWAEEYKPDDWDKSVFSGFNEGEPDIVYMEYRPEEMDGKTFNQDKSGPKGSITFPADGVGENTTYIKLMQGADLSTFLHESGHFFLEIAKDLGAQPDAKPQLVAMMKTLTDWFDTTEIGVEQHEQFARGFEAYLREGKAPSVELQSVFDRFMGWLIEIYKELRQLNVKLNNDVREVMDRMLATEDAINEVEEVAGFGLMFASAEEAGVSEEEYMDMKVAAERAHSESLADVRQKQMTELKKGQSQALRDERKMLREELTAKHEAEAVYQVRHILMHGTLPDGRTPVGMEGVKLSKQWLVDNMGNAADAIWKKLPKGKYHMVSASGMDVAQLASMFGYASGTEMVNDLATAPKLADLVKPQVDEIMAMRHQSLTVKDNLTQEAMRVVADKQRKRGIYAELRVLARRASVKPITQQALREIARSRVAALKVRDLQPNRHLQAMRKHSQEATRAMLEGDAGGAYKHKAQQLLNLQLYSHTLKARDRVEKDRKYLAKFQKPTVRKKLARDYLDQIDSILEAVSLKQGVSNKELDRRQAFTDWYDEQVATHGSVEMPKKYLEKLRTNFRDMPVQDLITLVDNLRNIEHLAKLKQQILVGRELRDFNETMDEAHATALEVNPQIYSPEAYAKKGRFEGSNTLMDPDLVSKLRAEHIKMEFLAEQMDGDVKGGTWWKLLFQPMAEAESAELKMIEELGATLGDILSSDTFKHLNREVTFTAGDHWDRNMLISVALNWGNSGNRISLTEGLAGKGVEALNIEQFLNKHMTKNDWDTVQQVWDLIDSYWPAIAALQKKLTGVVPEKVERSPVETPFGTYPGGYYPLHFDPKKNAKVNERSQKADVLENLSANFIRPATRKGHTNEREGSGGLPVQLSVDVISKHLGQVIHDIAFREAIIQTDRVIQDSRTIDAIKRVAGDSVYDDMRPWLGNVAGSGQIPFDAGSRMWGILRKNATIVNMGFKLTTAIVQPLGLTQTFEVLGVSWTLTGAQEFYGRPGHIKKKAEWVMEKSVMMRNRMTSFDRDIADAMRSVTQGTGPIDEIQKWAFHHIGYMDLSVTMPTWLGAYRKSLSEGKVDSDAVLEADSVVRMTQSSGSAKDLAMIQQGDGRKKMFTMFYSYFSAMYNLMRRRRNISRRQEEITPAKVARNLQALTYLVVMPSVLAEFVAGRGPDEEEEYMPWLAKLLVAYPFMSAVYVRDIASALSSDFGYAMTPLSGAIESLIGSTEAVAGLVEDPADTLTSEGFAKQLIMGSGYFLGLPSRQAWLVTNNLMDLMGGESLSFSEFIMLQERRD